MSNSVLAAAKETKNDEYYTRLSDIQSELSHYTDKFKDKTVFCNCDDPFESNFVKYFIMNFNRFGIKELIATGYKKSVIGGTEIGKANEPYVLRITNTSKYLMGTQKDLNIISAKNLLNIEKSRVMTPLIGNPGVNTYYEPGDFRSNMCLSLLQKCDIVVTNPPFPLFREFIDLLIKYQKQFLIIGNKNAVTYKEFFPLLKENKVWLGYTNIDSFITSGGNMQKFGNIGWFTNIDHEKRHQVLPLDMGYIYYGHEDMYPKYENYDAINVNKINCIPHDYMGIMGVPITFLDKYCPEQFKIIGTTESEGRGLSMGLWNKDFQIAQPIVNKKLVYKRIFIIRKDDENGNENHRASKY